VVPSDSPGLARGQGSKDGLNGSPRESSCSRTWSPAEKPLGAGARIRDRHEALELGGSGSPGSLGIAQARLMSPRAAQGRSREQGDVPAADRHPPRVGPPACHHPAWSADSATFHAPGVAGQAPLHRHGDAAGDRCDAARGRGGRHLRSDIRADLRDAKALQIYEVRTRSSGSSSPVTCWASSPHGLRVHGSRSRSGTPSGSSSRTELLRARLRSTRRRVSEGHRGALRGERHLGIRFRSSTAAFRLERHVCMGIEKIAKACATSSLILAVRPSARIPPRRRFEEQKKRLCPRLPQAKGRGLRALRDRLWVGRGRDEERCQALRNEYVLNGSKQFITGGSVAGTLVVLRRRRIRR